MNDTVLDNGGDVWTLAMESGGMIHYAVFRWNKDAKTASTEFTIEYPHMSEDYRAVPVSVKTAREEWNTLVAAGWTRTHRQNRSVAPQQVASRPTREPYSTNSNYALEA